jgi:MFS family permease
MLRAIMYTRSVSLQGADEENGQHANRPRGRYLPFRHEDLIQAFGIACRQEPDAKFVDSDGRRPGVAGAQRERDPLGFSVTRDVLPGEKLASAMALMSASLGVGVVLGLPLAALVAEHADWHVLFWSSSGLGVAVAVVPESPLRADGRFDLPGAVGLSAGLVALLLPISKGGRLGLGQWRHLGAARNRCGHPGAVGLVGTCGIPNRWSTCGPPRDVRCW